MTSSVSPLSCRICGKPVHVSDAKSDADGKAIHEDCYALKMKLERASQDGHGKHGHAETRPWQEVAAEIIQERDPNRMTELVAELNRVFDEQQHDGTRKAKHDKG